jgi:hypothetical protein
MTHGAKTKKALLKRYRQDYFSAPEASGARQKKGNKAGPHELIKSTKSLLTRYF